MKIIHNTKGQAKGRICVSCTLQTLAVGEIWETTSAEAADPSYIRVCASRLTTRTGRTFNVRATMEMAGAVIVTRTA